MPFRKGAHNCHGFDVDDLRWSRSSKLLENRNRLRQVTSRFLGWKGATMALLWGDLVLGTLAKLFIGPPIPRAVTPHVGPEFLFT